ncbi:hypothetical protein LCGC14_1405520 [marine sediment metagenome]|uniref:Uncharacterized protein n=1 Tax=marine sediment metagenome TaxID=412755 RepID=A0A0F9KGS1_9ZZZZ
MFYTNQASPMTLTIGDTYHDIAINIGAAITGAGSSPWTEVTGAGPTPAWLQPYASTVIAGRDPATFWGIDHHYTMYMDTDPGLSEGTPYCVLVRFWINKNGIAMGVLDTAVADPDDPGYWSIVCKSRDFGATGSGAYGESDTPNYFMSMSESNGFDTVTDDTRISIYIWMWDECLIVQVKDADNASHDLQGGGGYIWSPVNSGLLGAVRGLAPHIWTMPGVYDAGVSQSFTDYYTLARISGWGGPSSSMNGAGPASWSPDVNYSILSTEHFNLRWFGELGEVYGSGTTDLNGDEIIQRIMFSFAGGSKLSSTPYLAVDASFFSSPWSEGIRIVRAGAVTPSYLGTVTIDGDTYTIIKNIDEILGSAHQPYDVVFLVPNVDLTV